MSRLCSIPGCSKPRRKRDWCGRHYQRWQKHGDPLIVLTKRPEHGAVTRFLRDVAFPYRGDDCLPWPFSRNDKGYGHVQDEGQRKYAHRVVCRVVNGTAPSLKHEVAHSCGNCSCVNPRHLRWATRAENHADKLIHGTSNRGERHGLSKLSEVDIRAIRSLKGRKPQSEIAAMFGTCQVNVSLILRGKTWAWLNGGAP